MLGCLLGRLELFGTRIMMRDLLYASYMRELKVSLFNSFSLAATLLFFRLH